MATLMEIRNHVLETTGKDIFLPHPHLEGILDQITNSRTYGDITDYANLLENIREFCEDELREIGFRDAE